MKTRNARRMKNKTRKVRKTRKQRGGGFLKNLLQKMSQKKEEKPPATVENPLHSAAAIAAEEEKRAAEEEKRAAVAKVKAEREEFKALEARWQREQIERYRNAREKAWERAKAAAEKAMKDPSYRLTRDEYNDLNKEMQEKFKEDLVPDSEKPFRIITAENLEHNKKIAEEAYKKEQIFIASIKSDPDIVLDDYSLEKYLRELPEEEREKERDKWIYIGNHPNSRPWDIVGLYRKRSIKNTLEWKAEHDPDIELTEDQLLSLKPDLQKLFELKEFADRLNEYKFRYVKKK